MKKFWANLAKTIVKPDVLKDANRVLTNPFQEIGKVLGIDSPDVTEAPPKRPILLPSRRGKGIGTLMDDENGNPPEARMSIRLIFLQDWPTNPPSNFVPNPTYMRNYITRFLQAVNQIWDNATSGLIYKDEQSGKTYNVTTNGVICIDYGQQIAYDNTGSEISVPLSTDTNRIVTMANDVWVFVGDGNSDPTYKTAADAALERGVEVQNLGISQIHNYDSFKLRTPALGQAALQLWNEPSGTNIIGQIEHFAYFYDENLLPGAVPVARYAAHEFGHLFGLTDRYLQGFSMIQNPNDRRDRNEQAGVNYNKARDKYKEGSPIPIEQLPGVFVGSIVDRRVTMPLQRPSEKDPDYLPKNNLYSGPTLSEQPILGQPLITNMQLDIVFSNRGEVIYPQKIVVTPASYSRNFPEVASVYVGGAYGAVRDRQEAGRYLAKTATPIDSYQKIGLIGQVLSPELPKIEQSGDRVHLNERHRNAKRDEREYNKSGAIPIERFDPDLKVVILYLSSLH